MVPAMAKHARLVERLKQLAVGGDEEATKRMSELSAVEQLLQEILEKVEKRLAIPRSHFKRRK